MKKLQMLGLSLLTIILLTGCGAKTLTCTMEDSELGGNSTMTIEFESDEVTMMSTESEFEMDLSGFDEEQIDEILSSGCASYEGEEGLTCKMEETDNGFKLNLDMDFTKISDEFLENNDFGDLKESYDDVKEDMEEEGYTCK